MSAYSLHQLLERQDLWLGQQWQQTEKTSGYSTGFVELDAMLADGGWPDHGVCQLFISHPGQGEMGLLMPLLKQLTAAELGDDRHILLVGGEFQPSSQYLMQQGVDIERLLWVNTQDRSEQLWALEQGITSDACHLVIGWADSLSISQARRLQLACEKHGVLAILLLPIALQEEPHPVTLKLSLTPYAQADFSSRADISRREALKAEHFCSPAFTPEQFGDRHQQLRVLKRRGGWPATPLWLDLFSPQLQLALQSLAPQPQKSTKGVVHTEARLRVAPLALSHKATTVSQRLTPGHIAAQVSGQLLKGPWRTPDTDTGAAAPSVFGQRQS